MKARTFAFLAVLALVAAPVAMAQAPIVPAAPAAAVPAAPDSTVPTVEGTVVATGNTSLVISGDDGSMRTFLVVTSTVLPPKELAAGSRVVVRYKTLDADRAEAISVNPIAAPPAAGATSAGSAVPGPASEAPGVSTWRASPLAIGIGALVVFAAMVMLVARRRSSDEASFHIV